MTPIELYVTSVAICTFIMTVFIKYRINKDTACKYNPDCYSNSYITYFEIVALSITVIIPFVNIVFAIIAAATFFKEVLNVPVVKDINKDKYSS